MYHFEFYRSGEGWTRGWRPVSCAASFREECRARSKQGATLYRLVSVDGRTVDYGVLARHEREWGACE